VGRLNPAELKAQKLARSGVGGGGDRNARPDVDERRAIQAVLNYPPNRFWSNYLRDTVVEPCTMQGGVRGDHCPAGGVHLILHCISHATTGHMGDCVVWLLHWALSGTGSSQWGLTVSLVYSS
jgi:hypothetical protein